jgi:ATP-dependent DNA helicase RecQ
VGGVELIEPDQPLNLDEQRMMDRRNREFAKLDRMQAYTGARCRRRYIVEYFGEVAPFQACGTCDVCREGRPANDEPRPLSPEQEAVVLRVLSTVARMERHSGKQGFGVDLIAKVATGSKEKKVTTWGFEQLSTWGTLAQEGQAWTPGEVADVLEALAQAGALDSEWTTREIGGRPKSYRELRTNGRAWQVLQRKGEPLEMVFPHARKVSRKPARAVDLAADRTADLPRDLLAQLRDARRQLAAERNVPAYVIAPDRTLEDIARLQPTTRKAMLAVHGMGETRFLSCGEPFIEVVRRWKR